MVGINSKQLKHRNRTKHVRNTLLISIVSCVALTLYFKPQQSAQIPDFYFEDPQEKYEETVQAELPEYNQDSPEDVGETPQIKTSNVESIVDEAESEQDKVESTEEPPKDPTDDTTEDTAEEEPSAEPKTDKNDIPQKANIKKNLKAVLVVGPRNTGVQNFQIMAGAALPELEMDNYHEPQFSNTFVHCFLPASKSDKMCVDVLSQTKKKKKNLLIAADSFSHPGLDMEALSEYLDSWKDVTIIMYYRRFSEWLLSQFRAVTMGYGLPEKRPTIIEMLSDERFMSSSIDQYTTSVLRRYREYFSKIDLINLANIGMDESRKAFCSIIAAKNTCEKLKYTRVVKNEIKYERFYRDILEQAKHDRMVNATTDNDFEEMVRKAQQFHEVELEGGLAHFVLECPKKDVLDRILEETLNAERELFPGFFADKMGEPALRKEFEEQAKSNFCVLSAKETLMKSSWSRFIKQISADEGTDQ